MLPLDSSHYIECIRSNRFRYNIIGPTATQFKMLFSIYIRLEIKLEDTLKKQIQESFRVIRLQVQKKMWREKLSRTITRNVFDVEELKKLETEETIKSIQIDLSDSREPQVYLPSTIARSSNLSNK